GSGKTACIDIAIFALACQAARVVADRTAPRRIFFCVNRRVIVDEAHQRSLEIAGKLNEAKAGGGVLWDVASALRKLAGTETDRDTPPLDVLELRGGIYRDNRWARSATQATVICTTIDQLGSRLLFRGYGVSPAAAPIEAALIAYDSLVLLDEAHISQPFRESLEAVRGYLCHKKWAEETIGPQRMIFVPMTATPPEETSGGVIRLDERDRANLLLKSRLEARKSARLLQVADVAKSIVELAEQEAASKAAVGIIVNRIVTAKRIYKGLREKHPNAVVELVIGSMRPIDRDKQSERLRTLIGPERPAVTTIQSFVVSTQCLEVGADYDFDVLLTECASLDALRQRFGRLNRRGRAIKARGMIVLKKKDIKPDDELDDEKSLDPIYGNALARTWNWLWERATVVAPQPSATDAEQSDKPKKKAKAAGATAEVREIDFGIHSFTKILQKDEGHIPKCLLAPSAELHAPVMLPAYLDFWCQTSPQPVPDPDVALFIHGQQSTEPDVQVCWRCDLIEDQQEHWCDVVSLLPPTSAECMSVRISRVRRWLDSKEDFGDDNDLLEGGREAVDDSKARGRNGKEHVDKSVGVLWRGADKSELLDSPNKLRPGDTLVLPVKAMGWDELGHIPGSPARSTSPSNEPESEKDDDQEKEAREAEEIRKIDVAEAAFQAARDKAVLRLHPSRLKSLPETREIKALLKLLEDAEGNPARDELLVLMSAAAGSLPDDDPLRSSLQGLADLQRPIMEPYPDKLGVVLTSRNRLNKATSWILIPPLDDGDDGTSRISRKDPVSLDDHTRHVRAAVNRATNLLSIHVADEVFDLAAELHDWGKVDDRFQAWLRNSDRNDAWLCAGDAPILLAKSAGGQSRAEIRAARERAGVPSGFRHEMLSVQLAERSAELPTDPNIRDLILHLIAAHHGSARPFAPVVIDDEPPDARFGVVAIFTTIRRESPPHALDSDIGERFWTLTRRYGWWGAAFLEAMLRLADQQASADEDSEQYANPSEPEPAEVTS
ncbi:MAG: type I-U CRISPR-associated helicase/endonuclease Cas3, partial [Planctomycetota bacterium]|nr:type I-U CRISPR-associated helicase/endonuclease Cas3 [Planctomycetota bacterium]